MHSEKLSQVVAEGMLDKKADDVVIMDLRQVKSAIADFFVIGSGSSDTQLDAIAESVEKEVKEKLSESPWHREGTQQKEWILLDYVTVVAHVFLRDRREFFALEELWGDALITSISPQMPAKTL